MTQEQLIDAFQQTLMMEMNEASMRGLDAMHIANILMLASIKTVSSIHGVEAARAGLRFAADNLGADHG